MTILLGKDNKVEWYMGTIENPSTPTVEGYGKNGVRKAILEKMKDVKATTGKDIMVLLKPSDKSNYRNLVDILDEMKITNVQSYAIVDITTPEIGLLQRDNIY